MTVQSTTTRSAAEHAAAQALIPLLSSGATVGRTALNSAMTTAFEATDAQGAWTQRDSFEVLEHALALHMRATGLSLDLGDVAATTALMERLPTHTVRSQEQITFQQFSTPLDIAHVMLILANLRPDELVLEPSAGNGLLVAGTTDVRLQLNELDDRRRARLAFTFPGTEVTTHDGERLDSCLGDADRPTAILMNPPFSRSEGRGVDPLAAVRHLSAALGRLAPGGRVVTLMPHQTGDAARAAFEKVTRGSTVRTSAILTGCYGKHGTGVSVRLLVIDKVENAGSATAFECHSICHLCETVVAMKRPKVPAAVTVSPKLLAKPSLFGSMKKSRPVPPRVFRAPERNAIAAVAYATLSVPAPLKPQVGVYLPYQPSRMVFGTAGAHPTPLVESVAMGSIPAPIPSHEPHLPERTVSERLLSASQLETVVYAGDAWSQDIAGLFTPDKEGVGVLLDENGSAYRKGFFLGDGTGAGKGRQVAAAILDNWFQGRRRAIWVTKNEPLLEDARRDWSSLGGLSADVQPLSRWKIDQPIELSEGVLFVTYPTLRSARGDATRLQQLLDWAGADFEGVIAFDEAHEMGGVAGGEGSMGAKKGSQQGIAGVLLQNNLPRARVLYASATGASDVNNLAYAVRLGLWGPETAFANREEFIASIRQGGIAAMELVARDLKATGLYTARALSFAGVEYDVLRHELTPEQIAIYDTYADAWAIIHHNMEAALEQTAVVDPLGGDTLNSGAKAAARSRFESTKQRFFGQLLLSMKLPSVIPAVQRHLDEGASVVLQLVTTAESILDRRLGDLSADQRAELDIDLSPREYVIDYLDRAFPTRQMAVYTDDTGTQRSRPMTDERGHPVVNPDAEAARLQLIEHLCALPPIHAALDAILEQFGHDKVAEVTGRTKRLVSTADGRQKLETRSTRTSQAEAAAFMEGSKRILVFSDAGGTGRSYHASLDVPNQQHRIHFLLEPGWRADRAIQGLGRTHRTHQASAPLFRPVTTDCKGELRFTSTIARRLDSLGALTRGQRQTGGQNLFDPADNLESDYAKAALITWFHLLAAGKLASTSMGDFQEATGLELLEGDGVLKEELPPIQRWLNRLLALRIALQNCIFDEFLGLVEARVAAARDAGTLDIGVETITVETAHITDDVILRTDPLSGATSHLLTMEIARRRHPVSLERVLRIAASDSTAAFLLNEKSGKVALRTKSRSAMADDGTPIPRVEMQRPTRRQYLKSADLYETAWTECSRETFERRWTAEAEEAANRLDVETIRLATGLLLPIWSALPKDHMAVNRIADADGRSWLGRIVHPEHLPTLFTTLGIDRETNLEPKEVEDAVLSGGRIQLARPFACEVRRSLVNRIQRIEIVGAPAERLPWLKSIGCFVELISYKTRVFVPTGVGQTTTILKRLMDHA